MNSLANGKVLAMLAAVAQKVRQQRPVVHQITNYVSATDCANISLAAGASPIMADALAEMPEVVPRVDALVFNTGTFNEARKTVMETAATLADRHGKPVVLDPVGVGVSRLRRRTIDALLAFDCLKVVRGNASEAAVLLDGQQRMRGVDAERGIVAPRAASEQLAQQLGRTVAITGATDYLSDGERGIAIANGHVWLTQITGAGCMTTALLGACLAVEKDSLLAAAAALTAMGIAAELAAERASGPGTFHAALFDAIYSLTPDDFQLRGRVQTWGNWTCGSIS